MADIRIFTKKDNVFATIMLKGKILKAIVGNNFTDLSDVINYVCKDFNENVGLVQLNVRNQSQGWSMNMLLNIAQTRIKHFVQEVEPRRDGLQYCFAF